MSIKRDFLKGQVSDNLTNGSSKPDPLMPISLFVDTILSEDVCFAAKAEALL